MLGIPARCKSKCQSVCFRCVSLTRPFSGYGGATSYLDQYKNGIDAWLRGDCTPVNQPCLHGTTNHCMRHGCRRYAVNPF